jgi:molecular chaperone HtpG
MLTASILHSKNTQNLDQRRATDKDGQLVYLYSSDKETQYAYIETARNAGYDVLLMNGELDIPLMQHLEQKFEKSRFVRVDSDVIENLIRKKDKEQLKLSQEEQESLKKLFNEQLPVMDKVRFELQLDSLGENSLPVVLTQNEFMRRMQDMSGLQPGMSFYAKCG